MRAPTVLRRMHRCGSMGAAEEVGEDRREVGQQGRSNSAMQKDVVPPAVENRNRGCV